MGGDGPVGAVILAAGMSRRYGSPKQLVMIDGRTLLEHAIEPALAAELAPVVAVVPVWLPRPASLDREGVCWIQNPFPERGISLSLRLGFAAFEDRAAAAMVFLGDQPAVAPSTIAGILAARGERPVVAAEAGGVTAPPVLVERSHFQLVEDLSGDTGLRDWLAANPDLVQPVTVRNHPPDIDTPDDLGQVAPPRMRP